MEELVSVIVPIYNSEDCLAKCIESIIKQTYINLQIILVDDGSTDSCSEICDKYEKEDRRIKVIHKENKGASGARNSGLRFATGEYIAFVDSDDWIEEDLLEELMNCAKKNNADIVGFNSNITREKITTQDILSYYFIKGDISVWANLWHKKLFEEFSFISGAVSEDVMASYELFKKCEVLVEIPGLAGYHYSVTEGSVSRSVFKTGDYAAIDLTTKVANDVKDYCPGAYPYALLHTYKAMFNIINKAALYGIDKNVDRENFEKTKKVYINKLRRNIYAILGTKYFSKRDKIQIIVLCISPKLFLLAKHKYIKRTD